MVQNEQAKAAFEEDWAGIQKLRAYEHVSYQLDGVRISVGGATPEAFWNLPLILAYSVLDGVLNNLRDQGVYKCKSWKLGDKMEASYRQHLPWQNYKLVSEGREERNRLAHEAMIVPKHKCFIYIDAIEKELTAWKIL